jgi:hypothetical protein
MSGPYRDQFPPKRHRWQECGFNYSCRDCNGLWVWGTQEPTPENGWPCDNDDSKGFRPLCEVA